MLRLCIIFKPLNPLNNLLWLGGITIFLLFQVRKLRLQQWLGTWVQMVCSRAHTPLSSWLLLPQHAPNLFFFLQHFAQRGKHKLGPWRQFGWKQPQHSPESLPGVSYQICHGYVREQDLVSWWRTRGTLTPNRCWGSTGQGSTRHNYQSFLLRWNGMDMEFQETPCTVNENQVIFWIQTNTLCLQALLLGSMLIGKSMLLLLSNIGE